MKERPILFSGEMVRAILDGRKTQTRRVTSALESLTQSYDGPRVSKVECRNGLWNFWTNGHGSSALPVAHFKCPYGQPGDRLWVRETWATTYPLNDVKPSNLAAGFPCEYAAGGSSVGAPLVDRGVWRPSIHMPRWASRLTLEIVSVRVQRVQEITKADVLSEGTPGFELERASEDEARACFTQLWDTINRKRGFGWDKNPFCWVITFKRIQPC